MKKQKLTLKEEIFQMKGMMRKLMNEQPFNDTGEPMMTHQQYRDYSEPSEPDYDDFDNYRNDEYGSYKKEIENVLKNEGIKFKQFPVYGDNDEIQKVDLLIPDGNIFVSFKGESKIKISQYGTEEEEYFDLEDRPYPLGDVISYIKNLQK